MIKYIYIYNMYDNFIDNTENINEIEINNNKQIFDFYPVEYEYISPYDFEKYFSKDISFNNFTKNIMYILNYNIQNEELDHLKKFYKKSSILKFKLEDIYDKKKYKKIVHMIIIVKRLEYLEDYIIVNNFDVLKKVYLNNTLETIRNDKKKLIQSLFI